MNKRQLKFVITGILFLSAIGMKANNDYYSEIKNETSKNSPKNITIFGVGSSDSISRIIAGPMDGTAKIMPDSKSVTYIPNQNFSGIDWFVYEALNGKLGVSRIDVQEQKAAQKRPLPSVPTIQELQKQLGDLQKKLRVVTIAAGKNPTPEMSKEITNLTKQINEIEKIITARQIKEKSSKKEQLGEPATAEITPAAPLKKLPQELKEGIMGRPELRKFTQKESATAPSQKPKWDSMNIQELDKEFYKLNQALIKAQLTDPKAEKENTKQLQIDVGYIKKRLDQLEKVAQEAEGSKEWL